MVNGVGGLDDPELESRVRMVRLDRNTGPAGGFRAGLIEAFADPAVRWAYLCEDDVGLFSLPAPRLEDLLARFGSRPSAGRPVGAVVAYGRRFIGRGAHTVNVVPPAGPQHEWTAVDVACWGATLVAREVVDAGVLPDAEWFFGLEDFDFFCRVRDAGFDVLVDQAARPAGGGAANVAGARGGTSGSAADRRRRGLAGLLPRRGTPSPSTRRTVGPAGTSGTSPTRLGTCNEPTAVPSGRRLSTVYGTAPSGGWESIPVTAAGSASSSGIPSRRNDRTGRRSWATG